MSSSTTVYESLASQSGRPLVLETREVWSLQQSWREVYAAGLRDQTGRWTLRGYDWHVFSFGYHPCEEGNRAWRSYQTIDAPTYLVISGWIKETFGFRCTGKLPDLEIGVDAIVTADGFDWCMAFTHERGSHGPFFAIP
jgi:hypothetical protein